ncbi:MAG: restriction endonuclease subunit S [Methanosarcina sp.]|uniref:restriction endonuclease subunit S n=1 Tax=Methanosarcina sp. TaxID=2213 RepID=UPI00260F4BCE|nr:restriction endonuclease subunit S [Methanosarcina sp.]MDD3246010.1 restriction endonuclease subunit S [Methanosarcina sp.]MDD4248855.1 restriction endonuclease subunit S [Methanosarcina sp.]
MQQKSELPEGWGLVSLGELVTPSKEKIEPSENPTLKYIGLEHIESHKCQINGYGVAGDIKSTKTVFSRGDILYGKLRPYLNKVCIPDFEGICSTDILVFKATPNLDNRYLMRFLSTPEVVDYANNNSSGVQLPRVNFQKLSNCTVPLPPLAEQHRIVSAIEALFARLDATNEKLDRVPGILKKFRQSVLAAACDGRLTEAWREENKQKLGCTDFLNILPIENFDAYAPSDYDPIIPQSIPEEWKLSRCHNLCDNNRAVTYGVIKLGQPVEDGIPTLRSSDVRWLKIDKNHVKCISPEIASNYSRTFLKGGEILVTVRGTLGGVAVVPQDMAGFNISREVAVIPLISGLNSHFFSYTIASKWSQNWLSEMTKGVAYTGINIKDLKNLPLPVPPLPEQHEIVKRVDALFAFTDSIEAKVAAAREKTEKLRQSILAKVFSGELVEIEAEIARREGRDYETAKVLIEKIKAGKGKKE